MDTLLGLVSLSYKNGTINVFVPPVTDMRPQWLAGLWAKFKLARAIPAPCLAILPSFTTQTSCPLPPWAFQAGDGLGESAGSADRAAEGNWQAMWPRHGLCMLSCLTALQFFFGFYFKLIHIYHTTS